MGFSYDPYGQGTDDDPVQRAFGHPLGTNPEDREPVMKGLDWAGKGLGLAGPVFDKYGPKIIHAAEELGPTAGRVTEGGLEVLPGIGVGISALGAMNETNKLVNTIREDGPNAIHDQRFYNAEAGIMSNTTHALLGGASMIPSPAAPFLKAADVALTAGEVATDLTGAAAGLLFGKKAAFDSNSVEGGLLRAMDGDKSTGYEAGNWVQNKVGPGVGGAVAGGLTSLVVNAVDKPYNILRGAYEGITGEYAAAKDGMNNGEGLMGYDKTHGLNPLALPESNPLLMKLGLGGGNHPASHGEGASGSAASHSEGAGTHARAGGGHAPRSLGAGISAVARW